MNSPSNPTGRVLPTDHLRKVVDWARERGAVVASDECYISLGWEAAPVSVLHPDVCGPSRDGVLAVHSLSKRSNLAGYRAGFVTGDPALVADLLAIRKQAGMIMPGPVQAAMTAALDDDAHAVEQASRYASPAFAAAGGVHPAGWAIDHSEAGLYLWVTHPAYDCWSAAELLAAEGGILVAPGELYGPAGRRHVRVALTATDERIAAAAERIARRCRLGVGGRIGPVRHGARRKRHHALTRVGHDLRNVPQARSEAKHAAAAPARRPGRPAGRPRRR